MSAKRRPLFTTRSVDIGPAVMFICLRPPRSIDAFKINERPIATPPNNKSSRRFREKSPRPHLRSSRLIAPQGTRASRCTHAHLETTTCQRWHWVDGHQMFCQTSIKRPSRVHGEETALEIVICGKIQAFAVFLFVLLRPYPRGPRDKSHEVIGHEKESKRAAPSPRNVLLLFICMWSVCF